MQFLGSTPRNRSLGCTREITTGELAGLLHHISIDADCSLDLDRATWIATALDAGFATAMTIRWKWIRDISSLAFSGYYLFFANEADEKVSPLLRRDLKAEDGPADLSAEQTAAQVSSYVHRGDAACYLGEDEQPLYPILHAWRSASSRDSAPNLTPSAEGLDVQVSRPRTALP